MQDIIPAGLMKAAELDNFLSWLSAQRIDPQDKKQLLRLWADRVHIPVTRDMIVKAGIERR